MKAPPSSEKLQLLLPDPLHARRLRIILGAILVLAIAALLLLLTPARFHPIRAAVGVSLLLLLGGGVALFRFRSISFNPALRNLVAQLVSPAALCFFLALLVLRLLALLALDTDRSGQEILQANWGWLALGLIMALGLLFQARLGAWVDSLFFPQVRKQEQLFADLLDSIKTSSDLPEVSRRAIQTIKNQWQPQHIRILFADASLSDYHFSVDVFSVPSHLPANFPLQNLFAAERLVLSAPFLPSPHLTAIENAWLNELEAQVLVPLLGSNNRVVGVMALGAKSSAQPYTPSELHLLFVIARQIAFVSERAPLKAITEQEAQLRLARLARLEAAQRHQPITEENDVHDQLLVQEHLNDLPQCQEFPARIG